VTVANRRPVTAGWLWLGVGIAGFVALCLYLAFWQWDRAAEREASNAVLAGRLASDPVPLDALILGDVEQDPEDLTGWPVVLRGRWVVDEQVLIRGRALEGTPGFWVVAPLTTDDGLHVLVNRGWVGLEVDDPGDPRIDPGEDPVVVSGITMPGEVPTGIGPQDPATGWLPVLGILDIERIAEQSGLDLEPVVVQATVSDDPPEALPIPDVDDPGPHIAYVIQWLGFAVVALVGFAALVGRQLGRGPFARTRRAKESEDVPVDHRPPEDRAPGGQG
jgi:cytochrome oxidase assembly protein ShyY1